MPAYADYPHAERRIVVELAPPSPHLHQSERPFFEAPIRFTLSSSAKIVVIFQVSEVHVMKKNRSVLLMSLFSASLLVCVFTIVQAQNPGATAAKATKWSDAATWPDHK